MIKKILPIVCWLLCSTVLAQDSEVYRIKDRKDRPKETIITPYLNRDIVIFRLSGLFDTKKVVYLDTINGYKVEIPKWLELWDTNSLYKLLGRLPREDWRDHEEDQININSALKSDYSSYSDFKKFVITDPEYLNGVSPKWSIDGIHTLVSLEKDAFHGFDSYKLEMHCMQHIFISRFVFIETEKAYIWVSFASSEETYGKNIKKFKRFMKKFEVLEE